MSVATVLLMVLAGFAAVPSTAADEDVQVIVMFDGNVDEETIKDNGGKIVRKFEYIPGAVVTMKSKDMKSLEKSDKVKSVNKDAIAYATARKDPPGQDKKPPKDPPTPPPEVVPWGVDRIDAEWAWEDSTGNEIKVAVVDTGIDDDHPDLTVAGGVNFVWMKGRLDSTAWDDDNGHGTHVAGTIAGEDNTEGVIGVAPDASLYAVKVLNKRGSGSYSAIIAGIEWAISNDMNVISMSLSGTFNEPLLEAACTSAMNSGIVVVAASGNAGATTLPYPAAYDSVISVGATSETDALASWSNQGTGLDFVAPGVEILSTWKGGGYNTISGTSMACPHVSGTVALILQINTGWGEDSGVFTGVYNLLVSTADANLWGDDYSMNKYGNGLLDADEAINGEELGSDLDDE